MCLYIHRMSAVSLPACQCTLSALLRPLCMLPTTYTHTRASIPSEEQWLSAFFSLPLLLRLLLRSLSLFILFSSIHCALVHRHACTHQYGLPAANINQVGVVTVPYTVYYIQYNITVLHLNCIPLYLMLPSLFSNRLHFIHSQLACNGWHLFLAVDDCSAPLLQSCGDGRSRGIQSRWTTIRDESEDIETISKQSI